MTDNNSLTIYESKEHISGRAYDYANTYFLPLVCVFGLVTSAFSLAGSFKYGKCQSLKFIFINSVVDFLFLLTQFFVFSFRCGALCSFGYDYLTQLYQIQIYWFLGYTLVNSQCLFGIYVSVDRFRLFTSRQNVQNARLFRAYCLWILVAIGPNLFVNSLPLRVDPMGVYQPDNRTSHILYEVNLVASFKTPLMINITTAVLAIKDPTMYLVYCAINLMVIFRFQRFISKKKSIVSPSLLKPEVTLNVATISAKSSMPVVQQQSVNIRNESNFTKLTVLICLTYLLGNFLDSFSNIANLFGFDYSNWADSTVYVIGNFLFYSTHSVHFFIYYNFDKSFRTEFDRIFYRLKKKSIDQI